VSSLWSDAEAVRYGGWTVSDLHAWPVLTPLAQEYVPWSSASLRPAGLVAVLNDLLVHDRRSVLEFGSGVSTVFIARLLERVGAGTLVTLEHDERWAQLVRRSLERERLDHRVRLVHAPLSEHPTGWDSPWYDEDAVRGAVEQPVDLLLVDGPPAWAPGTEHARYPALPALTGLLTEDATIVLDDVDRPGEQAVLERWEEETGLRFERRPEQGGIAIARRGSEAPLGA
jgi:predicted O-methyltransferase YrrM